MKSIFLAGLLAIAFASTRSQAGQIQKDTTVLEPGKRIQRQIGRDQVHCYVVRLLAKQYVHFVVEQKGVDVLLILYGPNGKKILDMDSPNGTTGPEIVKFITDAAGPYTLAVKPVDPSAPAGPYEVRIEDLRAATAQDATSLAAQPAGYTPLIRLQSNIEHIMRSIDAKWGVYVKCVETGEEIALNADATMDTMSVIKIPLMAEVFRQAAAGKFSLSDRVILKKSDKRPGTGIISLLDEGASLTIKDLIYLMITVSDNTATDMLFRQVGGVTPVNELMHKYGLTTIKATGTADDWFKFLAQEPDPWKFHTEGKHPFGLSSPRDMGKLLERIFKGDVVSKEACRQMLDAMNDQIYKTRLPRYIDDFLIAHKTGDFLPYIGNDVGIIELPTCNVIICVFTAHHNGASSMLEEAIGRIAEKVSNYFSYQ